MSSTTVWSGLGTERYTDVPIYIDIHYDPEYKEWFVKEQPSNDLRDDLGGTIEDIVREYTPFYESVYDFRNGVFTNVQEIMKRHVGL